MMKSVQAKVILMFFIIGIIIILGIGFFSIRIAEQNLGNIENMAKVLNSEISQIKILILISILVFSCIMLIMSAFVIKVLVKPVNNLIKNAQKVAEGSSKELITVKNGKKKSKKQNKTKEKLHSQNCGCGVFYFYSGYNSRPAD